MSGEGKRVKGALKQNWKKTPVQFSGDRYTVNHTRDAFGIILIVAGMRGSSALASENSETTRAFPCNALDEPCGVLCPRSPFR